MITIDRAIIILESYGGEPSSWPEQERIELQNMLLANNKLTAIQQQALLVDKFVGLHMDENKTTSKGWQRNNQCAAQILAKLPEQVKQHPFNSVHICIRRFIAALSTFFTACSKPTAAFSTASLFFILIVLSSEYQWQKPHENLKLTLSESIELYVDNIVIEDEVVVNEVFDIIAYLEPQILEQYDE